MSELTKAQEEQAIWDELDGVEPPAGQTLADTLQTPAPGSEPEAEPVVEPDDEAAQDAIFDAEPAVKAEVSEESEVPEVAKPDPIAELNKQIAALAAQLSNHQRAVDGKIGGLANHLKQQAAEASVAKVAKAPDGPSPEAIAKAEKNAEKWKQLKADFPEWGDGIEDYVAQQVQAVAKTAAPALDIDALVKQNVAALVPQQVQAVLQAQRQEQARVDAVKAQIDVAHPDWVATINTPEFSTWQAAQAPGIRALANSDDPADAIEMLNLYRAVRPSTATSQKTAAQVQAERAARLKNSASPAKAVTTSPRTAVAVDDMDPDQLWAYLDRQDAAKAQRASR